MFCLKGQGVPRLDGRGKGDMLVGIRIVTPRTLDKNQKKLFEELARTLPQVDTPDGSKAKNVNRNRYFFDGN